MPPTDNILKTSSRISIMKNIINSLRSEHKDLHDMEDGDFSFRKSGFNWLLLTLTMCESVKFSISIGTSPCLLAKHVASSLSIII